MIAVHAVQTSPGHRRIRATEFLAELTYLIAGINVCVITGRYHYTLLSGRNERARADILLYRDNVGKYAQRQTL